MKKLTKEQKEYCKKFQKILESLASLPGGVLCTEVVVSQLNTDCFMPGEKFSLIDGQIAVNDEKVDLSDEKLKS